MSDERERVEHPSWCDREKCTAPEYLPTNEEYKEKDALARGEHRSPVSVLPAYGYGEGRELQVFISQAVAPWVCSTYLRFQTADRELSWSTQVGDGVDAAGFALYELLGLEVKDAVRKYPTLYAERFPYVQRAIEDEADEATAEASMPRDPVELEDRMAVEDEADEEAEETHECPFPGKCFVCAPTTTRSADEEHKAPDMGDERVTYKVTVNARELAEGTLQEARAAVADLVTRRLGAEPERVAEEALSLNMALTPGGAFESAMAEKGQWFTVFDAYGEDPLRIRVTKEE